MKDCACSFVRKASAFQSVKTWKTSTDPDYETKKNRVLDLYAIADGTKTPGPGDPEVVICMDEFGPMNLQPHPGKHWAPQGCGHGDPDHPRRRRRRATYKRPHGVRHLLAGYDLSTNRVYPSLSQINGVACMRSVDGGIGESSAETSSVMSTLR